MIVVSLIVLGCGFGLVMPNLVVAIQNAVGRQEQGAATATAAFFRSLGGTFGVALSGAIMTTRLQTLYAAPGASAAGGARGLAEQGIRELALLPLAQQEVVLAAYRHAISTTFLVGSIITAAAFVLVLFLPELPLKSAHAGDSATSGG